MSDAGRAIRAQPDRARWMRLWPLALGGLILGFALVFGLQALGRFATFNNRTFDLALYTRAAWGLSHGELWNPILDQHFFASHWSWVLAPLGLLGRLVGTAELLLVCQAMAMALTAWPLSRIGYRRGGPGWALLAGLCFLLYPNVMQVASYEFHPGNLALPALAFGFDAVDRRDGRSLLWSVVWVLLCRADYALVTGMLGLLSVLMGGPLAGSGRLVLGLSVGYLALVLGLRPLFVSSTDSADLHFGPWGGNPAGILLSLFTDPGRVFEHVSSTARLTYPVRILLPLALLPLLRARWLLVAAPSVAINLISVFPTTTELYSHYLTPAVPALVVATIDGLSRVRPAARPLAVGFLLVASVTGSFLASGAPWARDHKADDYRFGQPSWFYAWALELLPEKASVQAPDALLPHLAERMHVHRAPPPERRTDYVVLDSSHRLRYFGQETMLRTQEEPLVRTWMARRDHAVVLALPTLVVLRRSDDGPRSRFTNRFIVSNPPDRPWGLRLSRCLSLAEAHLGRDSVRFTFQVHGPCPADLALRMGPGPRPEHVRLMFDGYFSPVHLHAGEWVTGVYWLGPELCERIRTGGLWLGALRTSGAPPERGDPVSIRVPLHVPKRPPDD